MGRNGRRIYRCDVNSHKQQEDPLTTMTPGGPTIAQVRRLVTSIPGPRSQQLQARKSAAVARGVGSTLPVYVVAAGGGVVVDADGNSLIDLAPASRSPPWATAPRPW